MRGIQKILTLAITLSLIIVPLNMAGGQSVQENTNNQIVHVSPLQTEYIDGDWTISNTNITGNKTIILTGNLTITSTGNLTFYNVTLKMNCSVNGSYHIEVTSGGSLYIYDLDNDNTTTGDASIITSNNPDGMHRYAFWVRKDANFTMKNSELHECGYEDSALGDRTGIFIQSDNVTLDHNMISQNFYGMYLRYGNITITNNTIKWNNATGLSGTGIWSIYSNPTIKNNVVIYHPYPGITLIASNAEVEDNLVSYNYNGINVGGGSNKILNNTIVSNDDDGIFVSAWATPTIIGNYISGGNYGIASTTGPIITVVNTTIEDNMALFDISAGPDCHFIMIDCSFNKTNVRFSDSLANMTVQHFMHTYVNDTNDISISNANIVIENVTNSTVFTGQTGMTGWRNWTIVTEYVQNDTNGDFDGEDPGEKVFHTPHNLTVTKAGYFDGYVESNMNDSQIVVITLDMPDTTSPDINHLQVISANVSQIINITANITDDLCVDAVYLNYTDTNAANHNVSMNKWNSNWSYDIPGQTSTGFVDYFIWANDTSNNDNMTSINQIQINDITKPEINHASVTSANIDEVINITTNVTDDVSVNFVYLNYTGVNGTNYNVSMTNWNGNYSYEIPGQNMIGNVQYFIGTNDSDGNDNRTIEYSIQINDIVKPEINHVPAVSINVGGNINITVNVTDDVEVDKVYLNYTIVDGNYYNISMNKNHNNWSYDIPGQSNIGVVSYFIWANDTSGNDNQTTVYQIQINDFIKPEIEHTPITSTNISDAINITAQITDDIEVDSVYLNFTDVNGINHNVSMIKWNGNWSYEIPEQSSAGSIEYFIWCNDTSGNDNRTIEYIIQINEVIIPDTVPPSAPTGLNLTAQNNGIFIKWEASPEPDVHHYSVYRSTDNISFTRIGNVTGLTSYFDGDVSNDTTYYYKVSSVDNASNESPFSEVEHITWGETEHPPVPPDDDYLPYLIILALIVVLILIIAILFKRKKQESNEDIDNIKEEEKEDALS